MQPRATVQLPPMSKARGLERRLERLVDGIAARVFGGRVHPVELGTRLLREADLAAIEGPAGPTIPNLYVIAADLEAADHPARVEIGRELADLITDTAVEQGWRLEGPVTVTLAEGGKSGSVHIETAFEQGDLPPWATLTGTDNRNKLSVHHNRAVVGRSADADVTIPNPNVSRRHALLWRESERFWIADLGSANGTLVNGEPVFEVVEIVPADLILFGNASFLLRMA